MEIYAKKIPAGDKLLEHKVAYALLEQVVGMTFEMPLPEIARGEHGKPYFPAYPKMHFNLSHSSGLAVCGIGESPLGVDVEAVRLLRERVLLRSFSTAEQELVEKSPYPDEMFFRLWTLKESYVKALGIGISYPLQTVCFSLEGDTVVTNLSGYQFRCYQVDAFVIACCTISALSETLPESVWLL